MPWHTVSLPGRSGLGRRSGLLAGRNCSLYSIRPRGRDSGHVARDSEPAAPQAPASKTAAKEDILARIAKAKKYKDSGSTMEANATSAAPPAAPPAAVAGSPPETAVPAAPGAAPAPGPPTAQPPPAAGQKADWSAMTAFLGGSGDADAGMPRSETRPDAAQQVVTDDDYVKKLFSAPRRDGAGSATQAADWLQGIVDRPSDIDPTGLRMEEITAIKEARMKAAGADIITVDQNYSPSGDGVYKPTVSTWGVFPRPKDISKEFGGGRNIVPGQELESEEVRKARDAEYREALAKFKRAVGGELDPEEERAAEALYEAGMELFRQGKLQLCIVKFEEAAAKVPVRSKWGGLATLQRAIVLDSLGRHREAEALYKSLQAHPSGSVAKKAKNMLFGFEAMAFMKADTMSYIRTTKEFDPFFRRFSDANQLYVASEEERASDERMARLATLVSIAVLVGPIAMIAVIVRWPH